MKKFLLIILLIIISSPAALAKKATETISDETFQKLYGETKAQYEHRREGKRQLYKNELSKPLRFGKKGYFKRLRYQRALRKKLKKQHLI